MCISKGTTLDKTQVDTGTEAMLGLKLLTLIVVNSQLSEAQRAKIELVDYLYKPSTRLYGLNSCLAG